jgi:hypothetical protein
MLQQLADATGTDKLQAVSLLVTVIMTVISVIFMVYFIAYNPNLIGIALSSAALGGFLHEFLQSKGTVLFIQQKPDGLYLGSVAGFIFGMISGVFIIQANISTFPNSPSTQDVTRIFFEAFLAGLALKGASDAAAGYFKGKDDFQITSVSLANKQANISIKNDMQNTLTIQQVTVTDNATKKMDAATAQPSKIGPTASQTIAVNFTQMTFTANQVYTIVVYSTNGKQEKSIPA